MAKIVDENCMYIYISFIRFGQRSIKTFLGYLSSIITWTDLLKISSKLIRRWNFIMSFIIRSKIRIITCKYLGLAFFSPSLFLPIYRYITATVFQILTRRRSVCRVRVAKKFKWTVGRRGGRRA